LRRSLEFALAADARRGRAGDLAVREGPDDREISALFAEVYGADVSKDTISKIADKVLAR
jgi:transposase-like protein